MVETTAIALLTWLRDPSLADRCTRALQWLSSRCQKGRFSSTQATILSLRAIIAYDKAFSVPADAAAQLSVFLDGDPVDSFRIDRTVSDPVVLSGLQPRLMRVLDAANGSTDHDLRLQLDALPGALSSRIALPYSLTVAFYSPRMPSLPGCPLRLALRLVSLELKEGESTQLMVDVENVYVHSMDRPAAATSTAESPSSSASTANSKRGKRPTQESNDGRTTNRQAAKNSSADPGAPDPFAHGLPMCTAIIGLPGGLQPRVDSLRDLVSRRDISAFELRGREVVLYWRGLPPRAKLQFAIDVNAHTPGYFRGPASRAYLYYMDEQKYWAEPLHVRIHPALG